MYADRITPSMERAIEETNRRREKQVAYNEAHGINPQPLRKRIADILDQIVREDADTEQLLIGGGGRQQSRGKAPVPGLSSRARAVAAQAGERTSAGEPTKEASAARGELVGADHRADRADAHRGRGAPVRGGGAAPRRDPRAQVRAPRHARRRRLTGRTNVTVTSPPCYRR